MQQTEIKFFWPLTEQIPLDLDYGPTHLYYSAEGIPGVHAIPIVGSIYEFTPTITSYTTSINIDQTNITIISKNKQPLYRRVLFKLLGIKWKCET